MIRVACLLLAVALSCAAAGCGDTVVNLPTSLVVTNTSVNDGGYVKGLQPVLVFGFNRAVLFESLRDAENYRIEALDEGRPEPPALAARFPDDASERDSWTTIEITSVGDLAADTRYELTLAAGGGGASGFKAEDGSGLDQDYPFRFQTCPADDPECVPF